MMSDASEMLAAALEQMDGIIAGSKAMDYSNGLFDCQSPRSPLLGSLRAVHLLEDLQVALQLMDAEERQNLRNKVPDNTAESLVEWLQLRLSNGHGSGDLVYQERLSRLESDKECLLLQVSVLTDQVEVQGEKIRDLEMCLEEHQMKLNATEELLQQELLCRSNLDTEKLELLTEVSSLKQKLATVDHEKRESEGVYQELSEMHIRMSTMETEKLQQEKSLKSAKEELIVLHMQLEERNQELKRLQYQQAGAEVITLSKTQSIEKDRAKEEYDRAGQQETSAKSLTPPVTEPVSCGGTEETDEPQVIPCTEFIQESEPFNTTESKPAASFSSTRSSSDRPNSASSANKDQIGKGVEIESISPSLSPSQSSPRKSQNFGSSKSRASFGRGIFKIRSGKRTSSAPDLAAETGQKRTEHLDLAGTPSPKSKGTDVISPEGKKKAKGFWKFWGLMRRSQSTSFNLDDSTVSEFRRGGVRATAGPRLGWSHDLQRSNNNELGTFACWDKEQVCEWLQNQGLGLYANQAQHWIHSGQTLLNASQHDLEKELGIRHPLHKKKLQLALQALSSQENDPKGKLDFNWVTRWLDDIGLSQYKSQFDEGLVDGRMLDFMTVDDLLGLKVGNVLHHLGIKRAIQVLRLNSYEPNCLRRRPSDENNITPAEVCQWTNHRVMEWLRSVDLAEYAPNLRGSGVHGGLMVLEPRFNVETMALLLNIPPNKTLLRRHLATHFYFLIGAEAERVKQECLENPDYTPLTATAKVKPRRLSFGGFGTLRRKRHDDTEEFICPMDVQIPQNSSFHNIQHICEDNLGQLEQIEDSEGTVRQIEEFSEEINNLTSMLKEEELFREIPSLCPDITS